jgi:hypothetical protein
MVLLLSLTFFSLIVNLFGIWEMDEEGQSTCTSTSRLQPSPQGSQSSTWMRHFDVFLNFKFLAISVDFGLPVCSSTGCETLSPTTDVPESFLDQVHAAVATPPFASVLLRRHNYLLI